MVLDFEQDKRAALMRGFWSGLAAPASLFVMHAAPPVPQVQQIVPPSQDAAAAINGDWSRVGDSMRIVIGRYEQQQKE